MTKNDLIQLGEQLAAENNAAAQLWTWLPSHAVAVQHHGDYAAAPCPNNHDVMLEAALFLANVRRPDTTPTAEETEWFTSCPCGETHAAEEP